LSLEHGKTDVVFDSVLLMSALDVYLCSFEPCYACFYCSIFYFSTFL